MGKQNHKKTIPQSKTKENLKKKTTNKQHKRTYKNTTKTTHTTHTKVKTQ